MEKRKHILSMLLFVASCLFSNSAFAQTVESVEVDGIYYNLFLRDKTAEVTINPNKYSGEINIPGKIIYNNVTFSVASIGDNAFDDCTWLTSIAIPNSITTIGKYAFRECYCLEAVIIPNSVTSIGKGAFEDCAGLISLIIPNSVTSIGDDAFRDCTGLTSVTIPNSVTSIGGGAFDSCTGLKKVIVTDIAAWCGIEFEGRYSNPVCYAKHLYRNETTEITNLIIPNSVTSIGGYAFSGCSGLTSVTIPNSVTSIGSSAFYGCSGLTSVNIPNSVKSIGYSAFSDCSGLTSVTIPNSVTSIGSSAFSGCSALTSVTIPNSVTSIGDNAFRDCTGLTSVTIPNSVKSIGWSALAGCSGLTTINVEAGNTVYDSRNNCNAIIETATNTLIIGCKNSTIPNSVTTIGAYAFSCCSGLTSVTIGNSVKSIEFGAFGNCTELTDVYCYAEIVPSTASDAFYNSHIENATLHVPAASIEQYKNTIPWNKFGTFLPLDESVPDRIQIDGIYYNLFVDSKTAEVTQNPDDKYIGKINIPETVPYNGVTYSVTSIGESAFENCSALTSVTIPNSVTSIGWAAFCECVGLTSITIPNSVTSIGREAFCECVDLTSITIPNSVTSIGEEAFCACFGLTTINVEAGNTVYDSRNNCNAIIETATNTLIQGCNNTTIPNSVTSIGQYAFCACLGLTSVTIPNSVISIGEGAFCECGGLTSVNIGNSVKNIGSEAFADCAELTDVYCYAEKVPSTNSDAFAYSYIENATLHVPAASIEQYKTTTPWSNFGTFLLLLDETVPDSVQIDGIYYTLFVDSKTAEVTNNPNKYSGEINIPGKIIYNNVTFSVASIGSSAFRDCDGLTSVTIPNSVTSIGDRAFYDCDGLTSVTIPNSVTSIGDYAFDGCTWLTSVTIPNSVTSIGSSAFRDCSRLTSVTIGNSVTSIGDYAFCDCTRLTSVTIPNSVTRIGEHAFSFCSDLTIATIPNSVISDFAFFACSSLSSVTIGNGVTSIGKEAFRHCTSLTSVTIGNGLTSIGEYAFGYCSSLKSVHITDLEAWCKISFMKGSNPLDYAHYLYLNGQMIRDLVIPKNVMDIKDYAFNGCHSLLSLTIPDCVTSIGIDAFSNCISLASVTIGNSVTDIKDHAFMDCVSLTSFTVPDCVNSIGIRAFSGCSSLSVITLGSGVRSIEYSAFANCKEITDVYCQAKITPATRNDAFDGTYIENAILHVPAASIEQYKRTIPWNKFGSFIHLKGTVPDRIQIDGIYYNLFVDSKTAEITGVENRDQISTINIPQSVTFDDLTFNVTSIGDGAFDYCTSLTSVTIPKSVTNVGDYAFCGCGMTSIRIPNSVTSIGDGAFSDCPSLISITIPNTVTNIGESPFAYTPSLNYIEVETGNSIYDSRNNSNAIIETKSNTLIAGCKTTTIPNDVTNIGAEAFCGSDLTNIIIPGSVTSVGEFAFADCPNLTSIKVEADNYIYDSRNDCNAIIETVTNTLVVGCKRTNIPNSIESIGIGAFAGCSTLTTIIIPNNVMCIEEVAFAECTGLTSVYIGNGVKNIGSDAFFYCKQLTDVYCYAETVPSTDSDAFYGSSTENATLHVPAASIEQYKATEPWSNFGAIVPLTDEDAIAEVQAVPVLIQTQGNTIIVEGAEAGTEIILYSTNGVQLDSVIATTSVASLNTSRLSGSVAIVKIGDKTVKVLLKQ